MAVTLLTFVAEIGGVALALQLVVLGQLPAARARSSRCVVWLILWRAKFSLMENVLGLLGLALVVFVVALWQLGPDWGDLTHQLVDGRQARRRAVADLGLLRRRAVRRGA